MIIGKLNDLERYASTHKNFPAAMAFLRECLAKNVPDGKYHPDNDDFFLFISSGKNEKKDEIKAEAHHDYIDIQISLGGGEIIYIPDSAKTKLCEEFDPSRDVEFYAPVPADSCHRVMLDEGTFAIFSPGSCTRRAIPWGTDLSGRSSSRSRRKEGVA